MSELKTYHVRDAQGNVYGPADLSTLRQWVGEGRIIAGMSIAEEGSTDWQDVARHPGLADLFAAAGSASEAAGAPQTAAGANPYGATTSQTVEVTRHVSYASIGGQQLNVLALISMIVGIMSIVGCCCYGLVSIPAGIAAIVMAVIANRQFRNEPERYSGRGMATAGLICGIVGIVIGLAGIGFMIFAIVESAKHP